MIIHQSLIHLLILSYIEPNGTSLINNKLFGFLRPFSIKLVLMDQANIFIFIPMAEWLNKVSWIEDQILKASYFIAN